MLRIHSAGQIPLEVDLSFRSGGFVGAVTAIAVACAVTACSSSGSTPTRTATPRTSVPASSSASPTGPGLIVWVVSVPSGQLVRVLTAAGGSPHTITTLPVTANVLGAGAGKLGYEDSSDASIHVVSLATGTNVRYNSGAPAGASGSVSILGGAFNGNGSRFAYTLDMLSGGALRVLTLGSGSSTVLRTWGSGVPVDEPNAWTSTSILGTTVVGFSDAGPQAAVAIDPSSGAETATSKVSDSTGPVYAAEEPFAATAFHTGGLGDESDTSGAPGPPQPFNSVRVFTVGGPDTVLFSKAHHSNAVLAVSRDGASTLFYADTSAGAFAGISLSPDFGLFMYRSGATHQLASYDGARWDGGAFIDADQAVAARHNGDDEQLVIAGGPHSSPAVIDTVKGGDQPAFVAFSPTS